MENSDSADADIYAVNMTTLEQFPVVVQPLSQFDPYVIGNDIYYSNVTCVVDCGHVIQEIWKKSLITSRAEQITLLNSVSRQPVLNRARSWLYFSSNFSGNFHIWRQNLENGITEQLTSGNVTDTNPRLDSADNLYFIRRTPDGSLLMKRNTKGDHRSVPLPSGVSDIRDLEIRP